MAGLGSYIAHALAANGAKKVYITGRRLDKLQQVAEKVRAEHLNCPKPVWRS